jgi:hypothetical protein
MKFLFPQKVMSNQAGYQSLTDLFVLVYDNEKTEIILDFGDNMWFEANLSAILGAILTFGQEKLIQFSFTKMTRELRDLLERNGFLYLFGGEKKMDERQSTIQFRKFEVSEDLQFRRYLDEELLTMKGLPTMSIMLKKEISQKIFEIFENAKLHGKCRYVYSCGQIFPKKYRLDFTIADIGYTIRKGVRQFRANTELGGKECIEWAVEPCNTTKRSTIPGGLGFKFVRDFLRQNNGQIQIISSDGYWQEENGHTFAANMVGQFRGTAVNLEFNLNDKNSYLLASEIDPKDVF